jgi:hypothetical protein
LARERLASQLELARYTTELKPKLSLFKNSNEPSRAELLTSEFERVCELRVFLPALAAWAMSCMLKQGVFGFGLLRVLSGDFPVV